MIVYINLQLYLVLMTNREKFLGNYGEIPLGRGPKKGFQLRYDHPKFIKIVWVMIIDIMYCNYTWLLFLQTSYSIPHSFGNIQ